MKYIKLLLTITFLFIFSSCNEKNKFMTYTSEVAVIDIKDQDIFINNDKIIETVKDISQNASLMILPIDSNLKNILPRPKEIHIHLESTESYGIFFKILSTLGFGGYTNVLVVVENKYNSPLYIHYPSRNSQDPCNRGTLNFLKKMLNKNNEKEMRYEDKLKQRINEKKIELECAENNIRLTLRIAKDAEKIVYNLQGNLNGIIGGDKKLPTLTELELLNQLQKIQKSFQNKKDKNEITFVTNNDIKMHDIFNLLLKIQNLGYKIHFGKLGG